ncbi:Tyrosine-protein kinase YwqD [Tsuneonella dongtanensis]|uniref:Tyrosine-protein kinase YwqD n=1 Tax=Tsuneonella dongtanensis TaxID=692370 RepID=A0A1B2AF51_9SPHN|nr:AAA family ATPase [Tsuneonella dongtanensis]ANY20780.1 Tyrosine-protein kinase YwqD [Tsuneonella dongtanensis]
MTDQSKIPLPGEPGSEGTRESSLLERASGAFGLDPFSPAKMPVRLDEPQMKRAKAVKRDEPEADAVEPVPVSMPAPEPSLPVSAPQRSIVAPTIVEQPVRFSGPRHTIDREVLLHNGVIVPDAATTALLEEFRIVKRQVIAAAQAAGDAAARRVLVCSPHPGEGKTFCAVNLAIAMAGERDGEVLLVDADFGKPSVLATLGLPTGPGLMDALANPAIKVEDLVIATDIPGLFVLPAGSQTHADSEFLASARTAEVLDRLTRGAPGRMVVFDSPPALAASPAAELAKHVGQALLVCRADRTGRSALEDAVQLLGACPDIKLLLNAAHFSPSGRKFGNYYGYGG